MVDSDHRFDWMLTVAASSSDANLPNINASQWPEKAVPLVSVWMRTRQFRERLRLGLGRQRHLTVFAEGYVR